MIRRALRRGPLWSLAALTLSASVAVLLRSVLAGLALRLWLVGVGSVLCWAVAGAAMDVWAPTESPGLVLRNPWRRSSAAERLRQLEELERAVEFSLTTAFDLHFRLRPHIVRIATHRLSLRGVDLGAQPDRAREALGRELWELVRPDRDAPEARSAPGIGLARLRSVVDQLDAI